ncbi:MAG: response regulator, partial [Patescibacteria group bacterium]
MKILVVDDEVMLIEYLKRSLTASGHNVDSAQDGLEAYRKGSTNRYDAIILDVIMPSKNGIDVCRELRDSGIRTPVLMLSSRNTEEAKVQGLEAGADDYMV